MIVRRRAAQLQFEDDAAVAAVAREQVGERLEGGPSVRRRRELDRQLPRHLLAHRVDRQHVGRRHAHRLLVQLDFAFHHDHRARLKQGRRLRVRVRKHHDLDAAVPIFEHDHGHAIALARLQLPDRCDDAPNRHISRASETIPTVCPTCPA